VTTGTSAVCQHCHTSNPASLVLVNQ